MNQKANDIFDLFYYFPTWNCICLLLFFLLQTVVDIVTPVFMEKLYYSQNISTMDSTHNSKNREV